MTDNQGYVASLEASIDKLVAALKRIAEGDEPRPVGKVWNTDRTPSKHDKCVHDRWMYEDCGQCVAEFANQAIEDQEGCGA